jgi:hypothetical protein
MYFISLGDRMVTEARRAALEAEFEFLSDTEIRTFAKTRRMPLEHIPHANFRILTRFSSD